MTKACRRQHRSADIVEPGSTTREPSARRTPRTMNFCIADARIPLRRSVEHPVRPSEIHAPGDGSIDVSQRFHRPGVPPTPRRASPSPVGSPAAAAGGPAAGTTAPPVKIAAPARARARHAPIVSGFALAAGCSKATGREPVSIVPSCGPRAIRVALRSSLADVVVVKKWSSSTVLSRKASTPSARARPSNCWRHRNRGRFGVEESRSGQSHRRARRSRPHQHQQVVQGGACSGAGRAPPRPWTCAARGAAPHPALLRRHPKDFHAGPPLLLPRINPHRAARYVAVLSTTSCTRSIAQPRPAPRTRRPPPGHQRRWPRPQDAESQWRCWPPPACFQPTMRALAELGVRARLHYVHRHLYVD